MLMFTPDEQACDWTGTPYQSGPVEIVSEAKDSNAHSIGLRVFDVAYLDGARRGSVTTAFADELTWHPDVCTGCESTITGTPYREGHPWSNAPYCSRDCCSDHAERVASNEGN